MASSEKPLQYTLNCPACKRDLPHSSFERTRTARQTIRDYEQNKQRGMVEKDPYVLEWDSEERVEAAEVGKVLPRYKLISRARYEGKNCLECKPQAPWAGDLSDPAIAADAEALGILASMLHHEKRTALNKVDRQRKETLKRARNSTPMVKKRRLLMKSIRQLLAKESMSARNKMRYIESKGGDHTPYLFECARANIALVQAVHQFLTTDMKAVPSAVWQAALRAPAATAVLSQEDLLPLVALASADESYAPVQHQLLTLCKWYDLYLAQRPSYASEFPFLHLFWSQAKGIERLYNQLFALSLLDDKARGPRAALLASAHDPVLHDGEKHLCKALEIEEQRVHTNKRLFKQHRNQTPMTVEQARVAEATTINKPAPSVSPEFEAKFDAVLGDKE